MKQVIFNIGSGLSVYIEYSGKKILYDIGCSSSFSPVVDFLIPLFEKRKEEKLIHSSETKKKYLLDQLIISHPHDDHISAITDFGDNFYPELFTIPNDNNGLNQNEKINWDLIENRTDDNVEYIRNNILPRRKPPLKSSSGHLNIYWIKPGICENDESFDSSNYANNISIVGIIEYNVFRTFLAGDLMKDGMKYMIESSSGLKNRLKRGIDFLVAPHHGLKSSFSSDLFGTMMGGKTNRLNIISETRTSEDSNRVVDSRYSSKDYCNGDNNFSSKDSVVFQRKTSNGHICIDYSDTQRPLKLINDSEELINYFL